MALPLSATCETRWVAVSSATRGIDTDCKIVAINAHEIVTVPASAYLSSGIIVTPKVT